MLTRRHLLFAPLAAPVAQILLAQTKSGSISGTPGKMVLSIHQNTSSGSGFRESLEGWSKAGIKYVELADTKVDQWLRGGTETLATGKRLIGDLGLTPVSSAAVIGDVWIPGPQRAMGLETWKKRCEQFAELGLQKIYCPSITNRTVSAADMDATPAAISEAGDIAKQSNLISMIEFAHSSTHLSTLPTTLKMIRAANHPNVKPMLDFFHLWAGRSKFEDIDALQPGELQHVHFQDILDVPRERIDNNGRVIPGDGQAPVVKILQKLKEKQYSGAVSVELFLQRLTGGDPQAVAAEIKQKCEKVMTAAGVL
jgi:sugar phosphate isomerase/epimerase